MVITKVELVSDFTEEDGGVFVRGDGCASSRLRIKVAVSFLEHFPVMFELEVFHVLVNVFKVELGSLNGFAVEIVGEWLLFGPVNQIVVDDFHKSIFGVDSHGLGIGLEVLGVFGVLFHQERVFFGHEVDNKNSFEHFPYEFLETGYRNRF